jgi:TolB-like protein/lipoprotein NlpI
MLTKDGQVKIVDFGLAKLAGEHGLTKTGATVGTPHYMSPEQAKGVEVDPPTDVWSLGVVLYEMSTGRRPFIGATGDAVVHSILHERPERARDLRTGIPSMLERIIHKALEKDPDTRYGSVEEVLNDLRRLQTASVESGLRTAAMEAPVGKRQRRIAALGLVFLAVFVIVMTWVLSQQAKSSGKAMLEDLPRIVVLPFENLGPPEDEYFADGMTEEITSRLSAVSGLHVISRTSAMYYKGRHVPLKQIGEELNVQYALEGTVRWERPGGSRGRVRITPQLIEITDDQHLWSDRYDRAIESVFEVQSDIAEQVVGQLHVSLLKPEEDTFNARPTDNPEAYNTYLRGLQYSPSTESNQNRELAVSMFQRAVELDPRFALAWARLAEQHSLIYHYYVDVTQERRENARVTAERALALDPLLPEAHRAMGFYYYHCLRDYEQAMASFNQALALKPNDVETIRGVGFVRRRQGALEQSVDLLDRALALDPKSYNTASNLSVSYSFLRNHERAEQYADLAINLAPDKVDGYVWKWGVLNDQGRYPDARRVLENPPIQAPIFDVLWADQEIAERKFDAALARILETPQAVFERAFGESQGALARLERQCDCYFYLNMPDELLEACERAIGLALERASLDPENSRLHEDLGLLYANVGRKTDAIREGLTAVDLLPPSKDALRGPARVAGLALIYARVGDLDSAIDQLEYVLSIPSIVTVGQLRNHPQWDPLRDHPRFQALLEEYE